MDPLAYQIYADRLITLGLALAASLLAAGLTLILIYLIIIYMRLKKREQISLEMVTIEVRLSKDNEIKIDAADQMFSSFSSLKKSGFFSFLEVDDVIAFEIIGTKSEIKFCVSAPARIIDLIEKTIYSYYPNSDIKKIDEPNIFNEEGKVAFGAIVTKSESYLPLRTYRDLPTDTLAAITSAISKIGNNEGAIIQILIRPADGQWKKAGKSYVSSTKKNEANPEKATFKTDPKTLEKIDDKTSRAGFETTIRFVVSSPTKDMAELHLKNIKTAYSQFSSDLNNLTGAKMLFKGSFMIDFIYKFFPVINLPFYKSVSILSTDELASLFHFPNKTI